METKLAAIENCRKAGLKIVFVPTIVKGVNDHQLGDMVRFAVDNIDCVSGFSFQPVAFTGRINRHDTQGQALHPIRPRSLHLGANRHNGHLQ